MSFIRNYIYILVILILAAAVRFYRLSELMPFIGDQGWFYLSARDMLLTGNVPLVGITSSHTWLHQGPYWTYFLSIIFMVTKFNPIAPGYFTAFMGVLTVFIIYLVSFNVFNNKNLAILSSMLLAFSPIAIIHSRMPYHTSLISIFSVLFFYFAYRWINGEVKYFIFSVLSLGVLYNFELATQLFWSLIFILLIYGVINKKKYVNFKLSQVLFSIIAFLIPLIPVLIYDSNHGFPQTLKFAVWIPYKFISLFINNSNLSSLSLIDFYSNYFPRTIFFPSALISIILVGCSYVFILRKAYIYKKVNIILLSLFLSISFLGIIFGGASEAYLPMIYPIVFIGIAYFILEISKKIFIAYIIMLIISILNIYSLVSNDYSMGKYSGYGPYFSQRLEATKYIVKKADSREYNLKGKGEGSQFASFTMNYEYLAWWMGKPDSKKQQKLFFEITEKKEIISVNSFNN